ncbi:MAG: Transport permease protein [Pedobacter sp.]|jgi:lipopolysaccharide transport system permease protein|nr:Transport permease protein [Pedobacter sp.]
MAEEQKALKFWDWEINSKSTWLGVELSEIYAYRGLLLRLTRKDFLGTYQQTLLGPFWVLIQPLLTVITYVLVFNKVIGISTNGVPPFLFNLIGITLWNLFSEVFLNTAKSFSQNAGIFNKVYFPRIIVALSAVYLQLILFGIQLLLLIVVFGYFLITGKITANPANFFLIIPIIIITTGIAFGAGLILSVMTAKYRDLMALIQLLIRLLMFVCPVFYSLSMVPEKVKWMVNLNPLSSQFEYFRYAFIGTGQLSDLQFMYSASFMVLMVFFGVLLFNKLSDALMDVI